MRCELCASIEDPRFWIFGLDAAKHIRMKRHLKINCHVSNESSNRNSMKLRRDIIEGKMLATGVADEKHHAGSEDILKRVCRLSRV